MRVLIGMFLGMIIGFGIGRLDPETFNKGKEVVTEISETIVEEVQEVTE